MIAFPKPTRYQNARYREYIKMQPCCLCLTDPPSMVHHLSFISGTGQGTKPSDLCTVPLCAVCHRTIHDSGGLKEHLAIAACRMLAGWIRAREDEGKF